MNTEFCTQCGSKIENGGFCSHCGAQTEAPLNKEPAMSNFKKLNIKICDIWFYAGLLTIAIIAIMFISSCFKTLQDFSSHVQAYDGYIFLIPYYIIGFFPVISFIAVFFQRKRKSRYTGGIIHTAIILLFTVILLTGRLLLRDIYMNSGLSFLTNIMIIEYVTILNKSIFFEIVACIMFVIGKRTDTTNGRG